MRNLLLKGACLATSFLAGTPMAFASNQVGKVVFASGDQAGNSAGIVTFNLTGSPSSRAACASTSDTRWVLNLGNQKIANAYIYSLMLTAMSLQWQVNVVGTGTCSVVPYLEDIAYIEVIR